MLPRLKSRVRSLLPYQSLRFLARFKNRKTIGKTDDVRRIFSAIYKSNRWGGKPGEFYSGSGSDAASAADFVRAVSQFIADNNIRTVADLGCGDFRVGRQIARPGIDYVGIDVVEELVQHNREKFAREGVRFACLNIIEDEPPESDLCLIRQVLQHLSNDQISKILAKLSRYRFAIISEHHPGPSKFMGYNFDKAAGSDVRIYFGSGVYLDQPPFSLPMSQRFANPNRRNGFCRVTR